MQVQKQGISLGRVVDLTKFVGYAKLICELEPMFNIERVVDLTKFVGYEELICELEHMLNIEGELGDPSKGWKVVYTDNEGDMMLVHDDPWQ